jgi:hypothetical protein
MKPQLPKNVIIFIGLIAVAGLSVFLPRSKTQD